MGAESGDSKAGAEEKKEKKKRRRDENGTNFFFLNILSRNTYHSNMTSSRRNQTTVAVTEHCGRGEEVPDCVDASWIVDARLRRRAVLEAPVVDHPEQRGMRLCSLLKRCSSNWLYAASSSGFPNFHRKTLNDQPHSSPSRPLLFSNMPREVISTHIG